MMATPSISGPAPWCVCVYRVVRAADLNKDCARVELLSGLARMENGPAPYSTRHWVNGCTNAQAFAVIQT